MTLPQSDSITVCLHQERLLMAAPRSSGAGWADQFVAVDDARLPSWRLACFALSAAGAMLFAIKGVLIKLIYRYGTDTTRLLARRVVLAVPVFVLVGAHRWQRLKRDAKPDI